MVKFKSRDWRGELQQIMLEHIFAFIKTKKISLHLVATEVAACLCIKLVLTSERKLTGRKYSWGFVLFYVGGYDNIKSHKTLEYISYHSSNIFSVEYVLHL